MRSVTNFFLANLAVADLCVGIFCVIPNLSHNLNLTWIFGRVLCKMYYFVQAMAYTASITILTVISIERYMAIIHPIKSKQKTTLCLLRAVIVGVWTVSACCGIPNLMFYDTITIPGPAPATAGNGSAAALVGSGSGAITYCLLQGKFNLRAYNVTNLLLWYLAPLCLITVMYARISLVLWRTSQPAGGNGGARGDGAKRGGGGGKTLRHRIALWRRGGGGGGCRNGQQQHNGATYHANERRSAYMSAVVGRTSPPDEALLRRQAAAELGAADTATDTDTDVGGTSEHSMLVSRAGGGGGHGLAAYDHDDHSVAEDFEDDWPSSDEHKNSAAGKGALMMKYLSRQGNHHPAMPATTTNGLRINYPAHSPRNHNHHHPPPDHHGCLVTGTSHPHQQADLSPRLQPAEQQQQQQQRRPHQQPVEGALLARRRVIRLLLAVIASFALCVLPYHVRVVWGSFATELRFSFWQKLASPATFVLYYANSGLNPLLYAFLSANFRRSLRQVLLCQDTRRGRGGGGYLGRGGGTARTSLRSVSRTAGGGGGVSTATAANTTTCV